MYENFFLILFLSFRNKSLSYSQNCVWQLHTTKKEEPETKWKASIVNMWTVIFHWIKKKNQRYKENIKWKVEKRKKKRKNEIEGNRKSVPIDNWILANELNAFWSKRFSRLNSPFVLLFIIIIIFFRFFYFIFLLAPVWSVQKHARKKK